MFTICLISVRAALAALGPINLSRVILPVDRRIGVRPVGRVGGEGTEKTKHAIPIVTSSNLVRRGRLPLVS